MRRPELAKWIYKFNFLMVNAALKLLSKRSKLYSKVLLAENLDLNWEAETRRGKLKTYCPGVRAYSRSDFLKESKTYDWLETMEDGDTLWDVGACVGVYSLYAAKKGHCVFAFEPASFNYFVLCENIRLNDLGDKITTFNLALNNKTELGELSMEDTSIGSAYNSFISSESHKSKFSESMIGYSIDDIFRVFKLPIPNYIKIDVDGNEVKILEGAEKLLSSHKVKSIQIEVDDTNVRSTRKAVSEILESYGFHFSEKESATLNKVYRKK